MSRSWACSSSLCSSSVFRTSFLQEVWGAHDPISRSWASHPSSWPSARPFPKKSGMLTIQCHDREHAPWAREHNSPKSKIDSRALTIHVTIVSMSLQFVTPCRFELQRLVTYVTILSSDITIVSSHSAWFSGIVSKTSCDHWRPTQRLQQLYFWRVVYINSLPNHKWKVKHS